MQKAKVITIRTDYLNEMFLKVKAMKTAQLRDYLISQDINSDNYDFQVVDMIEREIDLRNQKNKTND